MKPGGRIAVILPALNEEEAIGGVLSSIPAELAATVIVSDNGSTDRTVEVARRAGALVVSEPERGYGAACLKAIAALASLPARIDIVVFLDADGSDYPEDMLELVRPIQQDEADLTIGSRLRGAREAGAMPPHQVLANRIFTRLIARLYGYRYTDLGPFRAIRLDALRKLGMRDRNFGWTAEMQIKALKHGLRVREIPVRYRKRIGQSKISGRLRPSLKAGAKIFWTIVKLKWSG